MECHWFKTAHCRSCEMLDKRYAETLALKEKRLAELFPGIESVTKATVGLEHDANLSRNKAKLAVFGDYEFGFYDSQANFKVLEHCPLHMEGLNQLLPVLKQKLDEARIIPYSVAEKKGELKYVIISKSASHNEFLVRFVLRSKESLDRLKKISLPNVKVMTANIQPEHKAVLEGEEEFVLTSDSKIIHQFNDVYLTLGPRSFFQVTPEIAGELYQTIGQAVKENQVKSFLDLYCGVGAFSFFAARNCPKVYGVEISKEAILCAQDSIAKNKISGEIRFEALDVEEYLKNNKEKYDAILVNPPRRGLNTSIIEDIKKNKPRILFYSSCNVETLKRDFDQLSSAYHISYAQIFDMFPYTGHFETLMIMHLKDF